MRPYTLFLGLLGTAVAVFAWQVSPLLKYFFLQSPAEKNAIQISINDQNLQVVTPHKTDQQLLTQTATPAPQASKHHGKAHQIETAAQKNFDAYAHFQMGNYDGAVNQLRGALKVRPEDELIQKNLATALLALGFFKLQKKELAEAEAAFEESTRLGNQNARKALAGLKLRQGQIEPARELLEDISKSGDDPESLRVLIDLALGQDELERADDLLNRMTQLLGKPEIAQNISISELMIFVESRKKRLEQKRNFLKVQDVVNRQGIEVSYSTTELRTIAESVAKAIEVVQNRLSQMLGPLPSHARLRAWLVPTNDFNKITGAPPWAAAVFDGYIRIPVGKTTSGRLTSPDVLARLAQHETTHAYMYAFCGDILPSWMGEGLAQVYEDRSVLQSQADLQRTLGRRAMQTIETEIERPFTEARPELVGRLYARSHLLINAMSREGGGISQTWNRILSAVCIQRKPLPEVLQEQFNASTAVELWNRYFSSSEQP